jgi:hypothetical protein
LKQEIAAQLCDWGAMAFNSALHYMVSLKIGNGYETIFFMKGKNRRNVKGGVKGGVSWKGRLWKVSILPKQRPGIECVDEDMAYEMAKVNEINRKRNAE